MSCAASGPAPVSPDALRPPPPSLLQPCERPLDLGEGPLPAGDVARLWALDRGRLTLCADRLDAVLDFYAERDAALKGGRND